MEGDGCSRWSVAGGDDGVQQVAMMEYNIHVHESACAASYWVLSMRYKLPEWEIYNSKHQSSQG